jgi:uncharacterized protein YutE (UPF0331/DUF86 family)
MTTDTALYKKASIEKAIFQARHYYQLPSEVAFEQDLLKQDAIAHHLERACEQTINLANHAIRKLKLGLPYQSQDSFRLLAEATIIPAELAYKLVKMVGFRNILLHQYVEVDLTVMQIFITHHLDDLVLFSNLIVQALAHINE